MKLYWAKHTAQKIREEAKRRRVAEKKEKKRTLEYLQQLQDKVLEEEAIPLESTEESQIVRPKYKEAFLGNDADYQPSKKAKGKQPARYQGDTRIKLEGANPCKRYVCARQDCLVHNSR